jgi:putative Mg2+ transporter-C (MgtC) family protein
VAEQRKRAFCGAGQWRLVAVALVLALLLLIFGGPAEKLMRKLLGPAPEPSESTAP